MLTMDKIHDIRFRFFVKGENISQISDSIQLDWRTVQKYVDMTDFNEPEPKPASEQRFCPKLDPYKPTIDKWLEEDNRHHVNSGTQPKGYSIVLGRKSADLAVHTGQLLPTTL